MTEHIPACILKYLIKGLETDRENQHQLHETLGESLTNAVSIVVQPVVDGFSVEIEISDLRPFNRTSYEPYVAEHVLPEAVSAACHPSREVQFQLLKSNFN